MIDNEMLENSSKGMNNKCKGIKECCSAFRRSLLWLVRVRGWYPSFSVVSFLAVAFFAVSCTDEVRVPGNGDVTTDAVIRLTIQAQNPQKTSTRSVDEGKIHDLYVLVYNSSGDLTGKSYSTFDTSASSYSVTVNTRSGEGCTIYAIANTGSATLFDGAVANTEDKLKEITTSSAAWDDLNNASSTTAYLPMSGSTTANISAGATTLSSGITVKRLVAKVTLHVGIADGSGVMITGYHVYGVPRKSYYVARPLNTEESVTDTQTTRAEDASLPANASDWTDSGLIGLSDVTSFDASFYLYENRAGVNTAITAQNQKVKANVPATPADSAAYVMIYGVAPGYVSLSWKIYLGANNTTNFNIKRNGDYSYAITLKPNDADVRIKSNKLIWAGSNIYWDETNQKLTFDASPVDPANPTEQELANMKKQGVFFKWGSLIGVSSNSGLDNSYDSSVLLYIPSYNSATPGNSSWQTKDGSQLDWGGISPFTNNVTDGSQINAFLNEIAQNTDANYLVYKGDICKYISRTGAVSGSWRMPTAKEFNAVGLADNTLVPWTAVTTPWAEFGNFGAESGNAQGTSLLSSGGTYTVNGISNSFPPSGYRRDSDGALFYVGQFGYYWSSSVYTDYTRGYFLHFYNTAVLPVYNAVQNYGFVVRCVQDN